MTTCRPTVATIVAAGADKPTSNASSWGETNHDALGASETRSRSADKPLLKRFEAMQRGATDARCEVSKRAMESDHIAIHASETTLRQHAGSLDRAGPMHQAPLW
jgi:hypothetical protein